MISNLLPFLQVLTVVSLLSLAYSSLKYFISIQRRENSSARRRISYYVIASGLAVEIAFLSFLRFRDESGSDLKSEAQRQLKNLDEIQLSLTELQAFVATQRVNLIESEKKLDEIYQERDKLQPIIEADKETVEAIFALQEDRNRGKVWQERLIGAFFGILSSLIAALIYRLTPVGSKS